MSLRTFLAAYIETALWLSTDESNEQGGEPLDANYSADDIAPETLRRMSKDCRSFYDENEHLWNEWRGGRGDPDEDASETRRRESRGISDERAGHDFWLTRNRHGAGFWDEGMGIIGDRLTDAAHAYGEVDLYVGDDGLIS